MMNILHLSLAQSWRGGEQQLAYLTEELKAYQCRQFIACAKGGVFEKWAHSRKFDLFPLQKKILYQLRLVLKLKFFCIQRGIDIIHAHDAHAHSLAFAAAIGGNKTPIIVSRRVDFPVRKSLLSRWKYNHPKVKKIVCVSAKIKEIMLPDIQDTGKLEVIYSGIDLQKFEGIIPKNLHVEFNIPEHHAIIGKVAALAPHKDYFTFINTAEILLRDGVKAGFLIIGEGPLENEIKQYITRKGMQANIIMTGFRDDVREILPSLDIFLITSETEGLGTSVLDAFAAGVPVIATKAGGITEMVEEGKTGLLADVKDAPALARQVKRLLSDAELKKGLIDRARVKVKEFDKSRTAALTFRAYLEVMKEEGQI